MKLLLEENRGGFKKYGKTLIGSHLIDGKDVSDGNFFVSTNPSQRQDHVGHFPKADRTTVQRACEAAAKAFKKWSQTPAPVRGQMIARFGSLLEKYKNELCQIVTREIGKTPREAMGSVQEAIDTAAFFQSEGRRLYGQTVFSEMPNKELFTYRRPLGVVGMITAGNFPVAVPSWKIIPAVLCGNTVVWKPSDDAPTCAALFGKLFTMAGFPPGVLNIVHGGGAQCAGEYLIAEVEHDRIQKFSFTGSSAVGSKIGEICGRKFQIPSLELGGKNPMIVMDDADLELALTGALWAAFGTGGQRCTSLGNLILHRSIAKTFRTEFLKRAESIVVGNPCEHPDVLYGPMINERFFQRWNEHLAWGQDGAQKILGSGRIQSRSQYPHFKGDPELGCFASPTIWDQVKIQSKLAQEEVFGPTVNLIEVKDFDEAMAAANGTAYGLSSAIYTQNPHLMLRFKNEIQAGMSSINNSTTGAEAHLPFGGTKASGNGTRESGIWVIDAYTRWHAVNVDLAGRLQLAQIETDYGHVTDTELECRGMSNLHG